MLGTLRQMLTCHWSARRIQRYLDADPAARLTPGETSRLEEHLATCERCAEVAAENRALHRALSAWTGMRSVDPRSVDRVRSFLSTIDDEDPR
ncbi:zf-HC2 domain-containing protein [Sanguibacter antarcticus]|uniref:Putative zinc finger protein n=1 Tax=Sanguibacter antarcticus TaxID=372484 RepID=A0A2A9E3U3_9MICO|nr:zf-HC2 domain-containing protein [Sanguibacter antarcticus]PFG32870.1 putative zinc finger protein [Sanguibacter antarcticus]